MQSLSDAELKDKTREFQERLSKGETLDDILPEAYEVVREADVRTLGMQHYRVQLIGGIDVYKRQARYCVYTPRPPEFASLHRDRAMPDVYKRPEPRHS